MNHTSSSPFQLALGIALLVLTIANAANAQNPRRCGSPARNLQAGVAFAPGDCAYSSNTVSPEYAVNSIYRIPVVVHVIQRNNGTGFIPDSMIHSQIDVLNEDFRAKPGTLGAPGYDTGIEFYLATEDPSGNPTTGITRHTNNTWYSDGGNYWSTLAWDTNRYLNIYTNNGGGALGYVPDIPQGNIVGQNRDRVVMLWETVGRNAPIGPPYNLGRTTTHEVGHYLGLYHTFDGGCSGSCNTGGDLICDTNPEAQPNFGCGSSTSCGSSDPVNNYMDYSDDSCMNQFTYEQALRMRCTLEHWRSQLWTRCELATVTNRNSGINPQSYAATPMVIGENFTATINTATTGHNTASLFGTIGSTQVTIFNGYDLLADLLTAPGNLLPLPSAAGPIAQISFTVPLDFALCGATLYTQAAHLGGAPGFALTNAQDCVVGQQ